MDICPNLYARAGCSYENSTMLYEEDYSNPFAAGMRKTANSSDESCKFFAASSITLSNGIESEFCGELSFATKNFQEIGMSIVLPRNSIYTDQISKGTAFLKERGSYKGGMEYLKSQGPACEPFESTQLGLKQMRCVLGILAGFGGLATISMLFACFYQLLEDRNQRAGGNTVSIFREMLRYC